MDPFGRPESMYASHGWAGSIISDGPFHHPGRLGSSYMVRTSPAASGGKEQGAGSGSNSVPWPAERCGAGAAGGDADGTGGAPGRAPGSPLEALAEKRYNAV